MKFAFLAAAIFLPAFCLQGQTLAQAEAQWRAQDYAGANNTFRALVAKDDKNPEYRVRWGRLLLERFDATDATSM